MKRFLSVAFLFLAASTAWAGDKFPLAIHCQAQEGVAQEKAFCAIFTNAFERMEQVVVVPKELPVAKVIVSALPVWDEERQFMPVGIHVTASLEETKYLQLYVTSLLIGYAFEETEEIPEEITPQDLAEKQNPASNLALHILGKINVWFEENTATVQQICPKPSVKSV